MLVEPRALEDLELELMSLDIRVWPVHTAPICTDGPRRAFQIKRRLLLQHRGEWDLAADWTAVWIGFGASWQHGADPLPWVAHKTLWRVLDSYAEVVRFQRRLGGIPRVPVPEDVAS